MLGNISNMTEFADPLPKVPSFQTPEAPNGQLRNS